MEDLIFKSEFYEDTNYLRFAFGLFLLVILTKIFEYTYCKYSDSPTNKKSFASIFVLFTISIFLIVTTIKSSLALSLGMVGALSIIRFRTAIKEPEQLVYFLGATGVAISIAAEKEIIAIIITIVFALASFLKNRNNKNLSDLKYLLVNLKLSKTFENSDLIEELTFVDKDNKLKCKNFYEDSEGNVRLTFSIENVENFDLKSIKQKLKVLEIKEFTLKMID